MHNRAQKAGPAMIAIRNNAALAPCARCRENPYPEPDAPRLPRAVCAECLSGLLPRDAGIDPATAV